jgi:NAD(P)-dependent dehydrogenase (short-subunit alcohol dehydrogenase family)
VADKLKGRVALVTGSGQGIGKAVAIALAAEGAAVITNNRKPGTQGGDAETVAADIRAAGGQAAAFFGSVSNFKEAEAMVKLAVEKFGRVDIVVNNAGSDAAKMVWNMAEEDWDLSVDSFLKSSFNCIRHAAPLMRAQNWGRIINTTSTAWLGAVGHVNYCAAKAGIVGLTRGVAREIGRYGVTCNAYAPTAGTRFTLSPETVAGFKKRFEAGLISKERFEELINPPGPETCAPFVVYLCTDAAANINGQVFDVTYPNISIYSEPVRKNTITKTEGNWTLDDLMTQMPKVMAGYVNPAPPQQTK